MDQWLNDAPALVYVRELWVWVVLNNNGNIIAWTDNAVEADRLSLWVLGYEKKAKPILAVASNIDGRKQSPISRRRISGMPVSPRQRNKVAVGSKNSQTHSVGRSETIKTDYDPR